MSFFKRSRWMVQFRAVGTFLFAFKYSAFQPRIYSAVPGHCRRTYAPTDHANVRPRTSGARKHRNPIMEGAERRRRRSHASEEKSQKSKMRQSRTCSDLPQEDM